jgi:DNA repair protein RadC
MAAFVWCGPDQFDAYELLELLVYISRRSKRVKDAAERFLA